MWDLKKYENNIAIIDEFDTEITYGELDKLGNEISSTVGERCLAFILCENSIGSILGYTAFINNHIVPVLLNANLEVELLENLVNMYQPKIFWVPVEQIKKFQKYNVQKIYEVYGFVLLKTSFDASYTLNKELCLMLTTSGSTGSPKFVRQSYGNVMSNAQSIAQYLELNESERPITTLPMNYTYGLSIINSHLLVGATVLATDKGLMQKEFWNFFKNQKATSFGGVPYTYEMLDKLRFEKMELPCLRYMTQAGGKLTPELHKKFAEYANRTSKKFIVMYGQCEATARMGYLPADKSLEKCGSMGIAIPGGKFRLIDIEGNEIKQPDITGELVYEGANVTLGYANCIEDLEKGDERGGVLETGDMARFDKDGYYYIVGRKKRFLKIYGNRVNLDEVDQMIKGHFRDIDVASAGVDDHMYIFISNKSFLEHMKISIEEIRQWISKKTNLNSVAFKVIVIDEIPKNDSGKTLYKELVKYYE